MLTNHFFLLLMIITFIIFYICDDNKKLIEGITFKWYDNNNLELGPDYHQCIHAIGERIKTGPQGEDRCVIPSNFQQTINECANKFLENTDVVQKALVTQFSREAIDRVYRNKLSDSDIYHQSGENQGEVKESIQNEIDNRMQTKSNSCSTTCPTSCTNNTNPECNNCSYQCLQAHKHLNDKTQIDNWFNSNNKIPRKYYSLKKHRNKADRDLASEYIDSQTNFIGGICIGKNINHDTTCTNKNENDCTIDDNCIFYKSAPCTETPCNPTTESNNFSTENLKSQRNKIYQSGEEGVNTYHQIAINSYPQCPGCTGPSATGNETEVECTGEGKKWGVCISGVDPRPPPVGLNSTNEQIKDKIIEKLGQANTLQENINTYLSLIGDGSTEQSTCGGVCKVDGINTTESKEECTGDKVWENLPCILTSDTSHESIKAEIKSKLTDLNTFIYQTYPKLVNESNGHQSSVNLLHNRTPKCPSEDTSGIFNCDNDATDNASSYLPPVVGSENLSIQGQKTISLLNEISRLNDIETRYNTANEELSRYQLATDLPGDDDGIDERIANISKTHEDLMEAQREISQLSEELTALRTAR